MVVTAQDLSKYDFIIVIDKSASMDRPNGKSSLTRWAAAKEATWSFAKEAAKYDDDGITVVAFNNDFKLYDGVTESKVDQVFKENSPGGGTDTAKVLKMLFDRYFESKAKGKAKPVIIQVITDGEPNDQKEVVDVIVAATKKMDADEEIGVQFIQYGDDASAAKFLKMLDDDLVSKYGAKFDIVDTKPYQEAEDKPLVELLLDAIND